MGNLQVIQNSRIGGSSVLGLWYVTGWEFVVVFSFLMYQFWNMLLEPWLLFEQIVNDYLTLNDVMNIPLQCMDIYHSWFDK